MKKIMYLIFVFPLMLSCHSEPKTLVNRAHLEYLTETVTMAGHTCDIVHIYADYPEYQWTDASSEGVACIDDVARAAVVYLEQYQITQETSLLPQIQRLLEFILQMQADDGDFYNFVDGDLSINRDGITSIKSFNFWAARGYWALGKAANVLATTAPEQSQIYRKAFIKCKTPLSKILQKYGEFDSENGISTPTWLVNGHGADATAEFLLGVIEYLKIQPDTELAEMAGQLADGILAMQQPFGATYPGAFLSWKNRWHGWANAQSQALAQLGVILQRPELVKSAQFEADHYAPLLLTRGMLREWNPLHPEDSREFEQIAYDIRPLALGLLEVAIATGDTNYAVLAGLAGSWLFGNNAAGEQMYDPKTGRCFDGINDSLKINMNSGAESTIEALYTLVKLEDHPVAARYLNYKTKSHGILDSETQPTSYYRVFSGPDQKQITLVTHWRGHNFQILAGDACQFIKNNSKNRPIPKVRPVK